MTKDELSGEVLGVLDRESREFTLTSESVKAVINTTMAIIQKAVSEGEVVTMRGFGSFSPQQKKDKLARNISTGERILIKAHVAPKFKPSGEFIDQVRTEHQRREL